MDDPTRSIWRIRQSFGDPPRVFGWLERWHLHIRAPLWCRLGRDELMLQYRKQRLLREEGAVVWGAIVQANAFLYEQGRYDCPATVIFSPDPEWGDWLWPLVDLAKELYRLKGCASYDPVERDYGEMLADERDRAMGICVPQTLADGYDARSTTVMIHRKHLPNGYLVQDYLPLLVHPKVKAAMVLPSGYWSEELLEDWHA